MFYWVLPESQARQARGVISQSWLLAASLIHCEADSCRSTGGSTPRLSASRVMKLKERVISTVDQDLLAAQSVFKQALDVSLAHISGSTGFSLAAKSSMVQCLRLKPGLGVVVHHATGLLRVRGMVTRETSRGTLLNSVSGWWPRPRWRLCNPDCTLVRADESVAYGRGQSLQSLHRLED